MNKPNNGLLTIADLCDRLHVSRNTAYRLLTAQVIPAFKVGRAWRIPAQNVAAFIDNQLKDKKEGSHNVQN